MHHLVLGTVILCVGAAAAAGCGGALAPPGAGDVTLLRWDPDLVRFDGGFAFRVLGEGFAPRGGRVQLVIRAHEGTPFSSGTRAVLEAEGRIDGARQIRGVLPDPAIPRGMPAPIHATVEVWLPDGVRARLPAPIAFEPARLTVRATDPPQLDGVTARPARLLGTGFGQPGATCTLVLTCLGATPFERGTRDAVKLEGLIVSAREIAFTPPEVLLPGAFVCALTLTLPDGAVAHSEDWGVNLRGPPTPPPLALREVVPWVLDVGVPTPLQVAGSDLLPIGGAHVVTLRFTADDGTTPFRGGTTDTLEVPGVVRSAMRIDGLGPLDTTLTAATACTLTVVMPAPDGREVTLGPAGAVLRPHLGAPRLVINEIDYDQPGIDDAEFVEVHNAGDGEADLDGVDLVFIQGGSGGGTTPYATIPLPDVRLPPGGHFVVAGSAATVPAADLDVTPDTNLLQNGDPDAVCLQRGGAVIDAVSYGGDAGWPHVEGSGVGLDDPPLAGPPASLQRVVDGWDTDDNGADLRWLAPATPGEPNDGPGEAPYAAHGRTLLRFNARTGEGVAVGTLPEEPSADGGLSFGGLAFTAEGALLATVADVAGTRLLWLDPADGRVLFDAGLVRAAEPLAVVDLAVHRPTSALHVLSDEGAGSAALYVLHPLTARATRIAGLPLAANERAGGLAAAADGTLLVATRGDAPRLLRLDARDGTLLGSAPLASLAATLPDVVGLAVRPSDDRLFAAAADDDRLWVLEGGEALPLPAALAAGTAGDLAFRPRVR